MPKAAATCRHKCCISCIQEFRNSAGEDVREMTMTVSLRMKLE
ncbi:MAG TPA: hypothetical protein H9824_05735 [Candidatus Bacteroides pullicola]|uniref:Zinc finger C3HC4 RING-type domain-containing protein n=1 Tax=Candidatus Bacteroides pullicola TaxID=2838475 RepID=A0A9D1ZI53_9BACE|nr:hypothetical protein [Candidatus Bacteroides pullicola]